MLQKIRTEYLIKTKSLPVFIICLFFSAIANGATISGTVYEGDGIQIERGPTVFDSINIRMRILTSPCSDYSPISGGANPDDGTYSLPIPNPGTYYLKADFESSYRDEFIDEWWTSDGNTKDCNEADPIIISGGEELRDMDFYLDYNTSISGDFYKEADDTLITDALLRMELYSEDACDPYTGYLDQQEVDSSLTNGSFTLSNLKIGTYHIRVTVLTENYQGGWWNNYSSDCAGASQIVISPGDQVQGTDFTLSPLPGDSDTDGEVSLKDTLSSLRTTAGMMADSSSTADINTDGVIGVAEAIYSLQDLAGLQDKPLTGSWRAYYAFPGEEELSSDVWELNEQSQSGEITLCLSDKVFQGTVENEAVTINTGTFSMDGDIISDITLEGTFSMGGTWRLEKIDDKTTCQPIDEWDIATDGLPLFVDDNHINISEIKQISKFRSAIGHDFSDDLESCRSMKHYYEPESTLDWAQLEIFSPVSGTIIDMEKSNLTDAGQRIIIRSSEYLAFAFIIFHVNVLPSIAVGDSVAAGQQLGNHIGNLTTNDIAVSIRGISGYQLVSVFSIMTDDLFMDYSDHYGSAITRDDFIISQEERDGDPIGCSGETFLSTGTLSNYVVFP